MRIKIACDYTIDRLACYFESGTRRTGKRAVDLVCVMCKSADEDRDHLFFISSVSNPYWSVDSSFFWDYRACY